MKIKHFLLCILIFLVTLSCSANQVENEILSKYKNVFHNWNIVGETRVYERTDDKKIYVNLIKKSNSSLYLYDCIIDVVFGLKNNNYYLKGYIIRNFKEMTYSMLDHNKKMMFRRKSIDKENYFVTEKIKDDAYVEDCYIYSFLRKKILKQMRFSADKNLYFNNSLRIKEGSSIIMFFDKPIQAKISINDNVIEFYQDQYGNSVYRFLEKVDNIDILNLDEVERYAKAKVESIEELKAKVD